MSEDVTADKIKQVLHYMIIDFSYNMRGIKMTNNILWDQKSGTFSTDMLKLTAMITMLIDHIGAGIIEYLIWLDTIPEQTRIILANVDQVMRLIGRIAFPLYCYLLVQGFLHTRSRLKYAGSLLFFAFLSEFPFDFMLHSPLDFSSLNVMFTLFIGLLTLWGIEKVKSNIILTGLISIAGMTVAAILSTDYSWTGILLIVSIYMLRSNPFLQSTVSFALFFLAMIIRYSGIYDSFSQTVLYLLSSKFTLVLSFWMIYRCNGKRYIKKGKYLFYLFYPVHLLVLGIILRLILYFL